MTWEKLDGLFEADGSLRKPTEEELAKHDGDTRMHIANVRACLDRVTDALRQRGMEHDKSKMTEPERSAYAVVIPQLAGLEYGTDEHRKVLGQMKPAIAHHQSVNRHHPQFHKNGLKGMDIIDLVEMVADWKAASLRGGDDFAQSMKVSLKRFGIEEPLASILINSMPLWEK